jgi:hypothetical protein
MTRLQKMLRIQGDVVRGSKCRLWQSSPASEDIAERIEEPAVFLHSLCLFIVVKMIVGIFRPFLLSQSRKPKARFSEKVQELTRVAN